MIEQTVEQKCTDIEKTEFEEQCTTEYEEVCETVQQYECVDEDVAAVAPASSYGVPKVSFIRLRSTLANKKKLGSSVELCQSKPSGHICHQSLSVFK